MKKILAAILCVCMILGCCVSLAGCGSNAKYTIGICQLVTHDALDAATKGFKDAVVKALGEENVEFIEVNAANNPDTCVTAVNDFVSKNVDLIMANATPALQAAYNATEEIPILGTSVTEYGVALDIKDFSGTVGGNVSGTSDLAPLTEQAQMIIDLVPEAKTVGMLSCSAEANSAYQVKVVKEYLEGKKIQLLDNGILLGTAGSVYGIQRVLAYAEIFTVPKDGVFDKKYIVQNIIPKLFKLYKEQNMLEKNKDQPDALPDSYLIAYGDKLFKISGVFDVLAIEHYATIGSGGNVALAGLIKLDEERIDDDQTINDRLIDILRTSESRIRSVGAPFYLIDTSGKTFKLIK
jgi:ABC-type uncharacterized transport system substrate-binding protein